MLLTATPVGVPRVDRRGFEDLVRLHLRRILAYAMALTRNADAAEDLVQEALLIFHRDQAKFDPTRDFGAWVRGIVRMKYLEWARSRRAERLDPAVLDALDRQHQDWDRAAAEGREDAVLAVRECMKRLPGHLGDALNLFYREDLSCAEIAARLDTSEPVIRKRLQRARESLAECIRRRHDGLGG